MTNPLPIDDEKPKKPLRLKAIYPYQIERCRREATWIISAIAESHNLSLKDILNPDRRWHVVTARREAMAAVHKTFPHWSYPVLGAVFERDHSTVMYSLQCAGAYTPKRTASAAE